MKFYERFNIGIGILCMIVFAMIIAFVMVSLGLQDNMTLDFILRGINAVATVAIARYFSKEKKLERAAKA